MLGPVASDHGMVQSWIRRAVDELVASQSPHRGCPGSRIHPRFPCARIGRESRVGQQRDEVVVVGHQGDVLRPTRRHRRAVRASPDLLDGRRTVRNSEQVDPAALPPIREQDGGDGALVIQPYRRGHSSVRRAERDHHWMSAASHTPAVGCDKRARCTRRVTNSTRSAPAAITVRKATSLGCQHSRHEVRRCIVTVKSGCQLTPRS